MATIRSEEDTIKGEEMTISGIENEWDENANFIARAIKFIILCFIVIIILVLGLDKHE